MASPSLLLVDDDRSLELIVGRLARRLRLETACAADVSSAWEWLSRHPVELVLLDVNLPGASGIDLLRRVRATTLLARQAVALFCQPSQMDDVAAGWRAGASYLLPKDLVSQPDLWQQRLEEILTHARSQAAAGSLPFSATASGQTTCDWATPLEKVFRRREARCLGEAVAEQVLRRALDQAFGSLLTEEQRARWVLAGDARLNRRAVPARLPRGPLQVCFASLVDQWQCLLGNEASAPLVEALRAVAF